jgi:hypothetical protein
MTDVGTPTPTPAGQPQGGEGTPQERLVMRRVELSAAPIGRMINVISLIAGVIAVVVVASVVAIAIYGKPIPDVLSNWGGIILGFYFGQFINLVKDYMGIIQTPTEPPRQA